MTKREKCVDWLKTIGRWEDGMIITCDVCDCSAHCKWAYDPYNTNGDCLGDK